MGRKAVTRAAAAISDVRVMDSGATLERLKALPIFYFDLGPLLSRRQSRSAVGAERIQLACERHVKRLAPRDLLVFEERGFFVVVLSCSGLAAQSLINEINIELLRHFFGTDSIAPDQLGAMFRIATPSEAANAGALTALDNYFDVEFSIFSGQSADDVSEAVETLPSGNQSARSGLPSNIEFEFQPGYDLRRDVASTYFCVPARGDSTGGLLESAALADLDPRVRPALDVALLEHSLKFSRHLLKNGIVAGVGASVSFETLAWSRGRQLYQQALRANDALNNPYLILKVCDVPPGTPETRLAEVVAILRPLAKRLFLQLSVSEAPWRLCGQLGITGFVAALRPDATPVSTARIATALMRVAGEQRSLASIDGVQRGDCVGIVRATGIRFATGSALSAMPSLNASLLESFRSPWLPRQVL
jgi:hypothetical protein